MKLAGAAWILAGALLMRLICLRERRRRRTVLEQLSRGLRNIAEDIRVSRTRFPILLRRQAEAGAGDAAAFFGAVSRGMEEGGEKPYRSDGEQDRGGYESYHGGGGEQGCGGYEPYRNGGGYGSYHGGDVWGGRGGSVWRDCARALPLLPSDRTALEEAASAFRGDEERIRSALLAAASALEKSGEAMDSQEAAENRRVTALALSGGAMLVILLL